MRKFNVTTTCVPQLHYMVDLTKKYNIILEMIEDGLYFTINRGRQKGKTTLLKGIARTLGDKYLVIPASFEGRSYLFNDDETFASNIFNIFAEPFEVFQPQISEKIKSYAQNLKTIDDVSKAISRLCLESKKEIVLLIDEVDKASNYYVFMDFLGLLRKKYIARQSNEDISFKS